MYHTHTNLERQLYSQTNHTKNWTTYECLRSPFSISNKERDIERAILICYIKGIIKVRREETNGNSREREDIKDILIKRE